MHNCDNCGVSFDGEKQGVLLTQGQHVAAQICGTCSDTVTLGKLIIRKGPRGVFEYEQWQAIGVG